MTKPVKIALVGRPNVGKSALFNRIVGKRISIVDEQEGVTRDRLYAKTEVFGTEIEMIDTGGVTTDSAIPFFEEIREQTLLAIEEADSLIMVVDSRLGVTSFDEDVAKVLHRTKKPVCVAVNKVDDHSFEKWTTPFYSLGFSNVVGVSAKQGFQIAELLEAALKDCPVDDTVFHDEYPNAIKLAIVGRPNVGKSTLLNHILGEKRSMVSDIPGTTRDAIDAYVEIEGQPYLLIDTAGIRKKKSENEVVDKFAAIRTEKAIERADVCLLVFDAEKGLTIEEKKILSELERLGKGCVLAANKWDLLKGVRMEHCSFVLHKDAAFTEHLPLVFISAITGRNISKIFDEVRRVHQMLNYQVGTGELNRFIEKAIQKYHPPMIQGRRLRIYYLTQKSKAPIEFILFINHLELMTKTYQRYLLKALREAFGFHGCAIRFKLQSKKQSFQQSQSSS